MSKVSDNVKIIKKHLIHIFESEGISEIEYQLWQSTDQSTLKTRLQDSDKFFDEFCNKLVVLRGDDFIAK